MNKQELQERLLKIEELKGQISDILTEVIMDGHGQVTETNYTGLKLKVGEKNDINVYTTAYSEIRLYECINWVIPADKKSAFNETYERGRLEASVKQAKIELAKAENQLNEYIAKK